MKRIQRFWSVAFGVGLVACSSDSRNDPSPAQMCRNLATECADFQSETLNECQRMGRRGVADETRQDECFVYYDSCIDQCRFYREFGEGLDGGAADGGAHDGGAPQIVDAAAPLKDASVQ